MLDRARDRNAALGPSQENNGGLPRRRRTSCPSTASSAAASARPASPASSTRPSTPARRRRRPHLRRGHLLALRLHVGEIACRDAILGARLRDLRSFRGRRVLRLLLLGRLLLLLGQRRAVPAASRRRRRTSRRRCRRQRVHAASSWGSFLLLLMLARASGDAGDERRPAPGSVARGSRPAITSLYQYSWCSFAHVSST